MTISHGSKNTTNAINFQMAFTKLQGMSTTLKRLPSTGKNNYNNGNSVQMSCTGSANPQVFLVPGGAFKQASSIGFNGCSRSTTIIVNVTGTDVQIMNAGIASTPAVDVTRVIWNFYEATRVRIASVGMPGSILAPYADMQMKYGMLNGSIAAWSMESTYYEYHWYPFSNNALVVGP